VVFVKDIPMARDAKLEPGRWHVKKQNEGVPDSYMPITTPDGGYREPDSGVLNEMADRDMWRTPGSPVGAAATQGGRTEGQEHDAALSRSSAGT
jgi:hypothetical protein